MVTLIMIIAINYLNWKITKKLFDNEEISYSILIDKGINKSVEFFSMYSLSFR